jgi:predicted permease
MKDLRYALRQLAKHPGFTAAAVTTLALGLGVTTAIVTLADATLFRGPALRDAHELAMLYTTCRRGDARCSSSYPDYLDYRDHATTLGDLAAYSWVPLSVGTAAETRPVAGQVVTGNYFALLGVPAPATGRFLQAADDARGAPPVIVISHELWQRAFGGSEAVVGQTVPVNDVPFTVVGVAPREFHGLELGGEPEVWLPLAAGPLLGDAVGAVGDQAVLDGRGNRWIHALVGRRTPGATLDQVRAEMAVISAGLQQRDPDARGNRTVTVDALSRYVLPIGQERGMVRFVGLLLSVVGLTLLLATTNIANLLLARAVSREREIGLRLAVGADRFRIGRQLVIESLTLAAIGGVAGLGVGVWTLDLLGGFALPGGVMIGALNLGLDGKTLGIAAGVTLVTGCAFGLAPALHAGRTDVMALLRGDTRIGTERSRLRWALVSAQVALCLVLLVGSGLFLRTLRSALDVDLGFREDGVALARFNPALARFTEDHAAAAVDRLLERAAALPGVEHAAVATLVPLQDGGHRGAFVTVDGYQSAPDEELRIEYVFVSDAFFETLGIPMRRGRGFRREDVGAQTVVVSETMARRYWADRDPIGGRIQVGGAASFEVVGVAGDATWRTVLDDPTSFVFLPIARSPAVMAESFLTLAVRSSGPASGTLPELRELFRSVAPAVPVTALTTMEGQVDRVLGPQRFGALILTLLGALAVVLATVGVYGVVAYTVSRETRSIGVRLALGGTAQDAVLSVMRRVAVPVAAGVGAGIVLALVLARAVTPFLVGVPPTDPLTFLAVTGGLLLVTMGSALIPARRASRVDPMEALRHE